MNLEIERKFLVKGDYRPYVKSSSNIVQGYIARENGRAVRVRIRDDKAYLTIKGPSDDSGIGREEWEREIPMEDARELLSLCQSGFIEKDRHLVPSGSHVFEIDEFHGDNEGLTIAEIELSYDDEPFDRPFWLGEEVTGDKKYYNSQLLKEPYSRWK